MTDVAKKFTQEEIDNISRAKQELIDTLTNTQATATMTLSAPDDNNPNGRFVMPLIHPEMEQLVVSGGCISSILRKEAVNDIDVFILNSKRDILNKLIEGKSGAWTIRFVAGNEDTEKYFENPHVIMTALNHNTRVQYILTDYKSRQELISEFDFLHCTATYVPIERRMYITHEAYDAIMNKKLIIHNKKRPRKTYREQKFIGQGWKSIADSLLDDTKTGIVWAKSGWEKEFVPFSIDEKKTFMDEMNELIDNIVKDTDPYLQTR